MSWFPLLFYSMASFSSRRGGKKSRVPLLPKTKAKGAHEREGKKERERERDGRRAERGAKYYESIFLTDWQSPEDIYSAKNEVK